MAKISVNEESKKRRKRVSYTDIWIFKELEDFTHIRKSLGKYLEEKRPNQLCALHTKCRLSLSSILKVRQHNFTSNWAPVSTEEFRPHPHFAEMKTACLKIISGLFGYLSFWKHFHDGHVILCVYKRVREWKWWHYTASLALTAWRR